MDRILKGQTMRAGRIVVAVVVLSALGLAGCGSDTGPGTRAPASGTTAAAPGTPAGNAGAPIKVDGLDACAVITAAQVQTFFGEPGGKKSPLNPAFAASCSYDDASGDSYLNLIVQAPPDGTTKQLGYDKGQTKNVKPTSGLGEDGFSWYTSNEVGVEIAYRGALVIISQQFYSNSHQIQDPDATIAKLTALAGPVLKQIP
jgi:hypothetical protein